MNRLLIIAAIAVGTAPACAEPPPSGSAITGSLQGGDKSAAHVELYLHALFDVTQAAFANGPDKVDLPAYQRMSAAIFRALGEERDGNKAAGEAMADQLKDIPSQMVAIAKADPEVLDSFRNFTTALAGPP